MSKREKIKVCTPYYSEYDSALRGFEQLEKSRIADFECEARRGSEQYFTRNTMISDKAGSGEPLPYDRFLMIDSDIEHTADHAMVALSHDADIIVLPYLHSASEGEFYNAGKWKKGQPGVIGSYAPVAKTGKERVDFGGGGYVLFTREVAEVIGYPWFMPFTVEYEGVKTMVSEDHAFFLKAQQCGFSVWCDFDHPVKHTNRNLKRERHGAGQFSPVPESMHKTVLEINRLVASLSDQYDNAVGQLVACSETVERQAIQIEALKRRVKERFERDS